MRTYKIEVNNGDFIIKITSVGLGHSSSRYFFKVYKTRVLWFDKLVWKEIIHRDDITSLKEVCDQVINNYQCNKY